MVAIHMPAGELESPRQVLTPYAEMLVLKQACASDIGPDPARELREPLLPLLPK